MRPHPAHAETDPYRPRAWATCDRCGRIFNHYKLRWQFDWRGRSTKNIRILICEYCEDTPQRQIGTIVLPPDPLPIMNARPEQYFIDETPVTTRITLGPYSSGKVNGGVRTLVGRLPPYRQRIIFVPLVLPPVAPPVAVHVTADTTTVTADNTTFTADNVS